MSLVANFNVYLIHTTLYLSLHNATDPIRGVNLHHRVLEHIVTLIRQVVKQLMRVLGTRSLHHNFQHHLVHSATQPCTFMCDVLQMGGEKVLGNAVQINKYKNILYIELTHTLTPIPRSQSNFVICAIPPGLSETVQLKRTRRPSAARPLLIHVVHYNSKAD